MGGWPAAAAGPFSARSKTPWAVIWHGEAAETKEESHSVVIEAVACPLCTAC